MVLYILLLIYAFVGIGYMKFNPKDYCSIHCGRNLDTVCKNMKPKGSCSGLALGTPMDRESRYVILNGHNEFRNSLAGGEVERFPRATNMKRMLWNEELEFMAQAWALQCGFDDYKHDFCRLTLNKSETGQILHSDASDGTMEDDFYSFFDIMTDPEEHSYPAGGKYKHSGPDDDDFYQMIWAETGQVGCAYVERPERSLDVAKEYYIVCNYFPKCCVKGKIIYKAGNKPCSKCAHGEVCDKIYPNLCVDPDMVPTNEPFPIPETSARDDTSAGFKFKAYLWVHLPIILLAVLIT